MPTLADVAPDPASALVAEPVWLIAIAVAAIALIAFVWSRRRTGKHGSTTREP